MENNFTAWKITGNIDETLFKNLCFKSLSKFWLVNGKKKILTHILLSFRLLGILSKSTLQPVGLSTTYLRYLDSVRSKLPSDETLASFLSLFDSKKYTELNMISSVLVVFLIENITWCSRYLVYLYFFNTISTWITYIIQTWKWSTISNKNIFFCYYLLSWKCYFTKKKYIDLMFVQFLSFPLFKNGQQVIQIVNGDGNIFIGCSWSVSVSVAEQVRRCINSTVSYTHLTLPTIYSV